MVKHRLLWCSFCRKNETKVDKLVAGPRLFYVGPRVYICDRCVAISRHIMETAPGADAAR